MKFALVHLDGISTFLQTPQESFIPFCQGLMTIYEAPVTLSEKRESIILFFYLSMGA